MLFRMTDLNHRPCGVTGGISTVAFDLSRVKANRLELVADAGKAGLSRPSYLWPLKGARRQIPPWPPIQTEQTVRARPTLSG